MSYEKGNQFGKGDGSNVTSEVSNHYGPRDTGGTEGNLKTEGSRNEYVINYDGEGPLGFTFPVLEGVFVTGVDETYSTTAVSAITIGGVDVSTATEAIPVEVPAGNTGVVSVTGPTAGDLILRYKRVVK